MESNLDKRIIIIGGGPTGIGAAYRLKELGHSNWTLYEKENVFGGLSGTARDKNGFLWDYGGHVSFSHYKYYDDYVDFAMDKKMYKHNRESWIKFIDAWVPYPFQNNIRYLDKKSQFECIDGLLKINEIKSNNFHEWVFSLFGAGIADKFMYPYNFKVWATPPKMMSADWIKERVSVIDVRRAIKNIILQRDDVGWGPNNKFSFPKHGGTGEVFSGGLKKIAGEAYNNKELVKIDHKKKTLYFKDKSKDTYDYLIITAPIDRTVAMLKQAPAPLKTKSKDLVKNSVYVVGIGVKKEIKTSKCWVYFPEKEDPFYRLTFFHNYSKNNVPDGDTSKYSSLMCEVSFSKYKKVDRKKIVNDCIKSLIRHDILEAKDRKNIVSKSVYELPYAYPVPTIKRDAALKNIQNYLMKNGIYSRGRFGSWRYEIGNMDHSFMQGVEAVSNIINNSKETIWSSK